MVLHPKNGTKLNITGAVEAVVDLRSNSNFEFGLVLEGNRIWITLASILNPDKIVKDNFETFVSL